MSEPYYVDESVTLWHGDSLAVLRELPDASVDCCVTSPPYFGLRDYGVEGQYGLEASPAEYVETMRALFAEVRRVLADDGTLWLNLGDSYSRSQETNVPQTKNKKVAFPQHSKDGSSDGKVGRADRPGSRTGALPVKNLLGIPWRVAFALQDDGWTLRNDIIWHKSNAMPESVTDRLSRRHEHVFLFSKAKSYHFDLGPIREPLAFPDKTGHVFGGNNPEVGRRRGATYEPRVDKTNYAPGMGPQSARAATGERHKRDYGNGGKNPGDVWTVPTQPWSEAHFAVMPLTLAERCVQAGCKLDGTVLDPFSGSGTTGLAAARNGRKYVGIDLSSDYLDLSLRTRLAQSALDFGEASA